MGRQGHKRERGGWLPGGGERGGVQEERGHQQVSRVLPDVIAEQLRPQPALRQAAHGAEAGVLLLDPVIPTTVYDFINLISYIYNLIIIKLQTITTQQSFFYIGATEYELSQ